MTQNRTDESAWLRTASLVILAAAAIALTLHYTRSVMIPFVLAIFTVSLVSPVLDFQVIRLKFPRPLAVLVTLMIVVAAIALLCFLLIRVTQTIIDTVGSYSDSFAQLAEQIFAALNRWGIALPEEQLLNRLRNEIPSLVTNTLSRVVGLLSTVFFVIIFVIFLLSGRNPHLVRSGVYADIDHKVRRYIATKVLISALTGVLVWAALAIFGVKLAGVFGIFAFLLNFIPSIGSVIATLLPIPIAVAQFPNPWWIVPVVAIPGLIQMVVGNILDPKLMGRGLNLHPITVLLALFFWGLLWGVAGMFLAAPLTAVIRIILMQFDTLRPMANLLAGELPGTPKTPQK